MADGGRRAPPTRAPRVVAPRGGPHQAARSAAAVRSPSWSAFRAGVERRRALLGGACFPRVRATGDARVGPPATAAGDELDPFGRAHPGGALGRVVRHACGQVESEAHEREVPADADGPRAVLKPAVVVDVCDVFKREPGPTVGFGFEADLDPGHVIA